LNLLTFLLLAFIYLRLKTMSSPKFVFFVTFRCSCLLLLADGNGTAAPDNHIDDTTSQNKDGTSKQDDGVNKDEDENDDEIGANDTAVAATSAGNALSKANQKLQQRHQQLRSRCADLENQVRERESEREIVMTERVNGESLVLLHEMTVK